MKQAQMSVELLDVCGSDVSVVNAARVSFDKESEMEVEYVDDVYDAGNGLMSCRRIVFKLSDKDEKLVNYLAEHGHHSPFNHCFLSFRVKAPLFVARQLVKHKFLPWNEVSRRYVDEEPEFFFPNGLRKKANDVKQGSSEEIFEFELNKEIIKYNVKCYKDLLELGVCPEQARMILPQNMMTTWIWSGTLGAFLDMLKLRLDPHTQKETREVATLIYNHVSEQFPSATKAMLGDMVYAACS
jgi:thymidylate synthase (FAD)